MNELVLLVDPDAGTLAQMETFARVAGFRVSALTQFQPAREFLARRPAALLTNIRLGTFNGIHLALLAKSANPAGRVVTYASRHDPVLACEAQRAGAFYERQAFLPYALGTYLTAPLPDRDRREALVVDRRTLFRGGRRCTDVSLLRGGEFSR